MLLAGALDMYNTVTGSRTRITASVTSNYDLALPPTGPADGQVMAYNQANARLEFVDQSGGSSSL
jgi:hypothetical protein